MADATSKIDAAAEKAFAEAAAKKTEETVSAKTVAKAVEADKPAPVKADKVAKAVAAPKKKKAAPKKKAAAKKTPAKKTVKKTAPKKAAAKKAAPKKATVKVPAFAKMKDTIMAKTNTNEFTKTVKEAAADMQARAKTAYGKGAELATDVVEFQKGNLEALVESGKVLAAGVQDMGRSAIEDTKAAAETVTEDVKKIAAVKSPTELFQLQGEIARRNFDTAVAQTSKNAEAMMKLANDVFAPISSRASVAAEKISKAA